MFALQVRIPTPTPATLIRSGNKASQIASHRNKLPPTCNLLQECPSSKNNFPVRGRYGVSVVGPYQVVELKVVGPCAHQRVSSPKTKHRKFGYIEIPSDSQPIATVR